ncbi:BTB/POZ-like protein [Neofusicoccum parvum]|uniref:Putative btb poz-like protein n=1 Tax=Botryosphaeria parva (strain UCR-NP2) TaxID=1287680 RepID=R1ERR6_BOTPV|nr:putative btb poz-like protein [Neofusicoccum parvum UCRNP2]GME42558.1 BTB/POZ-like protein [Neofusicoccum parvum]
MHWADDPSVIFVRDFAYPRPKRRRLRTMTSVSNIGDAPATTYAEYVLAEPLPDFIFPPDAALAGCENAPPREKRSRPPLPWRIYSHRLRVQAHAKNERARLLSGPLVDVFVGAGENKRQWSLHRNLLSYHSEYLASELQTNESTKNKTGNRLELPEDDPKGFELLVKWLYQGKLEDVSDLSSADSKYDYAVACHKLYMLCERFDMPQLKNMAIDQYRKGLSEARLVPDADEINDIYQKSPEGSPFRVLMTRIAARQIMDPDNDRDADNYRSCFTDNPDFAIDLVNAIKSGSGGVLFDDPTTGNECQYHDHEDGPNCYGKGKGKEGEYEFL